MLTENSSQGIHADPLLTPDELRWNHQDRNAILQSATMETFRKVLEVDGLDGRESVLDELSEYYGYTRDESLQRCLHWEDWSVEEWSSADRSTPEGIKEFYQSVESWSFDLMWYAYLQTAGYGYPATVIAARFAAGMAEGRDHLDFGSGTGTTAQLFSRLGFRTTMADISEPLLTFAAWRLARHGDPCNQIHLTTEGLPEAAFDFITALDTLVHVPDFDATVRDLHRAIRPGGYLLTNFDVRTPDEHGTQWHLYSDPFALDHRLRTAGFVRTHTLAGVTRCYRAVDATRPSLKLALAADAAVLPLRRAKVRARHAAHRVRTTLRSRAGER